MRLLLVALLTFALGVPATAGPDGPRPYAPALKSLERVALQLASGRKQPELDELMDVLGELGHPGKALARLRARCAQELENGKAPVWDATRTVGRLRRAVRGITKHLGGLADEERKQVATLVLRLDDRVDEAHEALGHTRYGKRWIVPSMEAAVKRATAIEEAVLRAKSLPIELATKTADLAFVEELQGGPGKRVSVNGWIFQSATVSPRRMTAILLPILRAVALSHWFETGRLEVPTPRVPFKAVVCGEHDEYFKAIGLSLRGRGIDGDGAQIAREVSNYEDERGFTVVNEDSLDRQQSDTLVTLWSHWTWYRKRRHVQPVLAVGHLNWLSTRLIGRPLSGFVWRETGSATAEQGADAARRKQLFKAARESIPNARVYLQYLEQRGQGPAFARAVQKQMSRIRGDAFIKATLVAVYLQEGGRFWELVDATTRDPRAPGTFVKALGGDLAAFEAQWRKWLLPMPVGLAGRLE